MIRLTSVGYVGLLMILSISAACRGRSDDTIRIGATFPLTGDNATYGEHLRNAIEIKVQDVNTSGGIDGKMIEVVYLDDANDPKQSVSNLRRLANVDKVPAVIGSAGSNCTLAMAPVANSTETLIISPTSSAEGLSTAGPFVYRTCASDAYQGGIIADWIYNEGFSKVGLLYVNNSWGVGMQEKFVKEFKELGGGVIAVESGEEGATDFRTQLTKLKESGAEALFMPTYAKQGGRVVKQARELGIDLPLFGADPWDVPEFREAAGTAAEGVLFTVFDQYTGAEYQSFAKKYELRYQEEPDFIAASGYDCILVLSEAMKQLADEGQPITGKNVGEVLRSLEAMGATGPLEFDENGDVTGKNFTRKTIEQGEIAPYILREAA